jgi:hypothetical protein
MLTDGRAELVLQANGSLLLATTSEEVQQLQARAAMLQQQGVPRVVLLSPRELKMTEPALQLPTGSQGLLVKSDAQIVSAVCTAVGAGAGAIVTFNGVWLCRLDDAACAQASMNSRSSSSSSSSTTVAMHLWRYPRHKAASQIKFALLACSCGVPCMHACLLAGLMQMQR